ELAKKGAGCELTLTHEGVLPEWADKTKEGWGKILEALDRSLSAASETGSGREIVITRVIDAPRERVWEAWADPDQVVKWWGPYGFTNKTKERSFKPGGAWRHTMVGP